MTRSPETRLFQAHWQDGVLDLVAGSAVLVIGLGYAVEQMLAPIVVFPLAFTAWLILRKQVVEPRAGYVEFGPRRRQRTGRELVGAVALGIGLLLLTLAMVSGARKAGQSLQDAVAAVPAVLIALAALVAAGLTRAWRFAGYAGVVLAAGAATVRLDAGPAMPLYIGGAVAGATGAALLVRFIAESRRVEEGE